uniref:Uncharacterized protein n=1 Tax=Babesia bovis TaxID=5865 RepID=S6BMJ2_BABBO|nr:hypothetical protein [Babesia bovis]
MGAIRSNFFKVTVIRPRFSCPRCCRRTEYSQMVYISKQLLGGVFQKSLRKHINSIIIHGTTKWTTHNKNGTQMGNIYRRSCSYSLL